MANRELIRDCPEVEREGGGERGVGGNGRGHERRINGGLHRIDEFTVFSGSGSPNIPNHCSKAAEQVPAKMNRGCGGSKVELRRGVGGNTYSIEEPVQYQPMGGEACRDQP